MVLLGTSCCRQMVPDWTAEQNHAAQFGFCGCPAEDVNQDDYNAGNVNGDGPNDFLPTAPGTTSPWTR
jgi:hypothetical protein